MIPVAGTPAPSSRQGAGVPVGARRRRPFAVNLVCVNADVLERCVAGVEPAFFEGRHTIGFWWWEVPRVPDQLLGVVRPRRRGLGRVAHVADAFAPVAPKPVVKVHDPGERTALAPPREPLRVPSDFLFLFLFDPTRHQAKEPARSRRRVPRAFAPGDGAMLMLKSINGGDRPADLEAVRGGARTAPDIVTW